MLDTRVFHISHGGQVIIFSNSYTHTNVSAFTNLTKGTISVDGYISYPW